MIRTSLWVGAAILAVSACAWPPPGLQLRDNYMGRAWLERDVILQPSPRTESGIAIVPGTATFPGVPAAQSPVSRDAYGNPVLP